MIFHVFLLIIGTSLHAITCYPQAIKIPEIKVSPPEQVNSLEGDETIISGGRSISQNNKENNVEETIKEVEDIINSNPNLPRLTRGEILDILENITVYDNKAINDKRDPKAIMVVMPYTPANDDNKSMEDLFTKPPITQIVNAEPFRTTNNNNINKRRKNSNTLTSDQKPEATSSLSSTTTTRTTAETTTRNTLRRRRPTIFTTTTTTTTAAPITVETTTTIRTRNRRPTRRRTTTATTKHPNHRYPEEEVNEEKEITKKTILRTQKPLRRKPTTTTTSTFPPDGIKIIDSPDLATEEDNTREVVLKQVFPVDALPTTIGTTYKPLIEEIHLPIPLKSVAEDLNLEEALKPQKPQIPPFIPEIITQRTSTPSTTTLIPDVSDVADSLSPEMRDLLRSFGLLPDPNAKIHKKVPQEKFYPEKAEISSDSYVGFKPLPENGPGRNEMEALLATFGLGRDSRNEKSLKQKDKKELNFDGIPEHLKGVLTELGLSEKQRDDRKINYSTTKQHIFNPDTTNFATEEELEKLTKLLDMVKQLGKLNGTATEDDFKKIDMNSLKELLNSFNNYNKKNELFTTLNQIKGPDPNNFDSGLVKNEIKRQTSTTTTTEKPKNPSLSDLEASFGGETSSTTEAPIPETTPRKQTGFYYLVDWNTFLDIDDQKGKRVNLRFQPTVGDPKRFYSVSVP